MYKTAVYTYVNSDMQWLTHRELQIQIQIEIIYITLPIAMLLSHEATGRCYHREVAHSIYNLRFHWPRAAYASDPGRIY